MTTPRTDEFLAKNGAAGNDSKYAKFTRRLELENQRLRIALEHAMEHVTTDEGCAECAEAQALIARTSTALSKEK